jgi:hypothetical protein
MPPWAVAEEPRVVPRVLDGSSAGALRSIAIAAITVMILAAILVGLGVAHAITEVLDGRVTDPREISQ